MDKKEQQPVEEILEGKQKENLDAYADHLKKPLFGLEDKRVTVGKALDEEE